MVAEFDLCGYQKWLYSERDRLLESIFSDWSIIIPRKNKKQQPKKKKNIISKTERHSQKRQTYFDDRQSA